MLTIKFCNLIQQCIMLLSFSWANSNFIYSKARNSMRPPLLVNNHLQLRQLLHTRILLRMTAFSNTKNKISNHTNACTNWPDRQNFWLQWIRTENLSLSIQPIISNQPGRFWNPFIANKMVWKNTKQPNEISKLIRKIIKAIKIEK